MKELEELKKILSDDEEVKEYFKPNKKRFVTINIIFSLIFIVIILATLVTIGILGVLNVIEFTDENGKQDLVAPIMLLVMAAPLFVFSVLTIIGYVVRYKRTLYVITNKRLIVRSGFIGVDYKSIELKYVGLVNVRVDFLDKISGCNTGTISIASPAIPMNGQNNANGAFMFRCIDDPYEVYKKVKACIPENNQ